MIRFRDVRNGALNDTTGLENKEKGGEIIEMETGKERLNETRRWFCVLIQIDRDKRLVDSKSMMTRSEKTRMDEIANGTK